jgi:LCP family protein required for cell wall assembly
MSTTPTLNRRTLLGLAAALGAGSQSVAAQDYATPAELPLKDVYTFLVLGMDTRPDESELNTDVMMVSRVDLTTNTVRSMSIPRDLYVEIPGVGFDKINQAFKSAAANGREDWMKGMAASKATMEHNFGVPIDAVLSVRFEGVKRIIDAFGGVTFNNPYELRDEKFGNLYFPAGEQHINGEQALQLMRSRNQDGDDGRVMRQQLILSALLEKARDPAIVVKLPELIVALQNSVITTIPTSVQLQLAAAVPTIEPENVVWGTMTHLLWGGTIESGMWVYQGDWTQLPGYMQAFLDGTLQTVGRGRIR